MASQVEVADRECWVTRGERAVEDRATWGSQLGHLAQPLPCPLQGLLLHL